MAKHTRAGAIHIVTDESGEPRATIKNPKTASAVAAATCGAHLVRRGYLDFVEVVNGKPVRRTSFLLDANSKLHFKPNFPEEKLSVSEVIRRFEDPEWCAANPDHPIAFLHFYRENMCRFIDAAKARKPGRLIRRGNRFVMLDDGLPRETEERFLKDLRDGI